MNWLIGFERWYMCHWYLNFLFGFHSRYTLWQTFWTRELSCHFASKLFANQDWKIFAGQALSRYFLDRFEMPNFSLQSFVACSLHSSVCFVSDRFVNSTRAISSCFDNHQFKNYLSWFPQNQYFGGFLKSFGQDILPVRDHLENLECFLVQLFTGCNSKARQAQEEVILLLC